MCVGANKRFNNFISMGYLCRYTADLVKLFKSSIKKFQLEMILRFECASR